MARLWRLPALVVLLVGGLLTEAVLFPLAGQAFRRAAIRRWSRLLVAACGLTLKVDPALAAVAGEVREAGEAGAEGRLIVANHASWLDIFAINAVAPAAFVAGAEIRRWPVIGLLVAMAGTVFIERGRRRAVHQVIATLRERMGAGWPGAVFPEAMTTDGRAVLPFHANLIEAACLDERDVLAVAIAYRNGDGAWPDAVVWVGETTFLLNLWAIIGARGLSVELVLGATIATAGRSRHDVAREARDVISRRLALPLADSAPGTAHPIRA